MIKNKVRRKEGGGEKEEEENRRKKKKTQERNNAIESLLIFVYTKRFVHHPQTTKTTYGRRVIPAYFNKVPVQGDCRPQQTMANSIPRVPRSNPSVCLIQNAPSLAKNLFRHRNCNKVSTAYHSTPIVPGRITHTVSTSAVGFNKRLGDLAILNL